MSLRVTNLAWGRLPALATVLMCALSLPALAQPEPKRQKTPPATAPSKVADKSDTAPAAPTPAPAAKKGAPAQPKEQNFNFDGMSFNGKTHSPQLLYFLERANEELERASLEKRSFIPHMVRSLEEEAL